MLWFKSIPVKTYVLYIKHLDEEWKPMTGEQISNLKIKGDYLLFCNNCQNYCRLGCCKLDKPTKNIDEGLWAPDGKLGSNTCKGYFDKRDKDIRRIRGEKKVGRIKKPN